MFIIDNFTKWLEIIPLRNAKVPKIVEYLNIIFCRYGFPRTLVADNGSQWLSTHFSEWCRLKGIKVFYQSPYHACSNPTERYIGTAKALIRTLMTSQKDWDTKIEEIVFALNTSCSEATGFTPAYLNFLRELRTPFDNVVHFRNSRVKEVTELQNRIMLVHDIAREQMLTNQDRSLRYSNRFTKETNL